MGLDCKKKEKQRRNENEPLNQGRQRHSWHDGEWFQKGEFKKKNSVGTRPLAIA